MKVIIVGLGSVGARFAELVLARHDELLTTQHLDLKVVGVCDSGSSVADPRGLDLNTVLERKRRNGRVSEVADSPDIPSFIRTVEADAVVELTPTDHHRGEPGKTHFRAAMESGKHVVTANKGPLATSFPELTRLAHERGVRLLFGAAVGGGNPVLKFGEVCARAEPVLGVDAVVNRTSTYILSQMETRGIGFDEVLQETQRDGLAEPDPSLDVDGFDAACKIVILANHILGRGASFTDVDPVESIRDVTPERIRDAKSRGRRIRMVGRAAEGRLSVDVMELEEGDPLLVHGKSDMTRFHCKYSGPKLVGSTSGGPAFTAMGLLRDLLEISSDARSAARPNRTA